MGDTSVIQQEQSIQGPHAVLVNFRLGNGVFDEVLEFRPGSQGSGALSASFSIAGEFRGQVHT